MLYNSSAADVIICGWRGQCAPGWVVALFRIIFHSSPRLFWLSQQLLFLENPSEMFTSVMNTFSSLSEGWLLCSLFDLIEKYLTSVMETMLYLVYLGLLPADIL